MLVSARLRLSTKRPPIISAMFLFDWNEHLLPIVAILIITAFVVLIHIVMWLRFVRSKKSGMKSPAQRAHTTRFHVLHCLAMIGLLNAQLLPEPWRQIGLPFGLGLFAVLIWWITGLRRIDKSERASRKQAAESSN